LAETLAETLGRAGIPVEVACFTEDTPLATQVATLARAAVVISVHGSQLTNLAWLRKHSVVIEVTLRIGWCRDPWELPPHSAIKGQGRHLKGPKGGGGDSAPYDAWTLAQGCKPYHKADFANMARFFNMRYLYYDPWFVGIRRGGGAINVREVLVDSNELAAIAAAAYQNATGHGPS